MRSAARRTDAVSNMSRAAKAVECAVMPRCLNAAVRRRGDADWQSCRGERAVRPASRSRHARPTEQRSSSRKVNDEPKFATPSRVSGLLETSTGSRFPAGARGQSATRPKLNRARPPANRLPKPFPLRYHAHASIFVFARCFSPALSVEAAGPDDEFEIWFDPTSRLAEHQRSTRAAKRGRPRPRSRNQKAHPSWVEAH